MEMLLSEEDIAALASPSCSVDTLLSPSVSSQSSLSDFDFDLSLTHINLPPEIILEILSLCAWEEHDNFSQVSPTWRSYVLKSLRRIRYEYPLTMTLPNSEEPVPVARYTCGTHRLLRSLTMSFFWARPTDELRLNRRSDGTWWKEGEITEGWLSQTFYWSEPCTDPPVKDIKIKLKGAYWNGRENDLTLSMTCFASDQSAVTVADVCGRVKRLFAASCYRNVLVYDLQTRLDENGTVHLAGFANLTKKRRR